MRYPLIVIFIFLATISLAQNTLYFEGDESLFRSGLELLDKSELVAARQQFEKYIAISENKTKSADAKYYVAYCALGLYHKDGEKRIEEFIDKHPDHPKAVTAYFELGNFYFKEKKYKKAVEYYSKVNLAQVTEEERNQTRFNLGYSYFTDRQFSSALEYFNVLKRQSGKYTAASNYYAGYIEYHNNQYDKAILDLERAAKDEVYAAVAPELLANLYYKEGRYDDLIEYGERNIKSGARFKDIYLLLGDAYAYKKELPKAIEYYKDYESASSKMSRDVRYRIGYAYYKEEQFDKAIDHLKRAASDKDSIGIYASYYLGVMYLKNGNKLYAKTAFLNARENTINDDLRQEGAYQYAKVSYDLGDSENATEAISYYLNKYPKGKHKQELDDLLSEVYLNSNNYDLAIAHIESQSRTGRVMEKVYQKATYLKGSELFNKGEYSSAISLFKKSLKYPINDQFTMLANLWTAEAYSVGRKYSEARPYYQKLVVGGLSNDVNIMAKARYGLAYANFNTKDYSKALLYFKAYVGEVDNKNPNYNDALIRLADCYYISKQYDEAINYYNQATETRHSDMDYALYQLGLINGIQGNIPRAVSSFDKVISISRSRYVDDAMFQKGQMHFEKGNYEEAVRNFSQLINNKPSSRFIPYAYLRRGSANYNLQKFENTISDYESILTKYNTSKVAGEVLLPLQEVLNLVNRSNEFDQYLANYKKSNPDKKGLEGVEFETAKNQYFNQNYREAIKKFEEYINSYPDNAKVVEAKYYRAESYYRLKEYEQALEIYNELFDVSNFDQRNRVIGRIAEIEYTNGRYQNAIYFYRQLETVATTKKQQYNVWSGLMESYYLLGEYDSVTNYATTILEDGNVHISSQNKALLFMGKASYGKGNFSQAEDDFLATLNTARDQYGAEALYMLGLIYNVTKEYNKSIESLIDLNNNFSSYTEWVGKGFLLLAENYLSLGDTFQAKGTLKSIADDFPDEYYREKAKQKIIEIEKYEAEIENQNLVVGDSLNTND